MKVEINKRKRGHKISSSIDIHCEILAVPFAQRSQMQPCEPSEKIRERVIRDRNIQTERFSSLPKQGGMGWVTNSFALPSIRMGPAIMAAFNWKVS